MGERISIEVKKETDYLPFVSESLGIFESEDVACMCIVAITRDNQCLTSYHNCNCDDKILMAKHIEFDVNDTLIKANFDKYLQMYLDNGGII
jgi:hypothetical protein